MFFFILITNNTNDRDVITGGLGGLQNSYPLPPTPTPYDFLVAVQKAITKTDFIYIM